MIKKIVEKKKGTAKKSLHSIQSIDSEKPKHILKLSDAKKVCNSVIAKLRPSAAEKKAVTLQLKSFVSKLNKALAKHSAKAVLGGSGAKDTWLSGSFDADVFVMFDYKKYSDNESVISEVLGRVLKSLFKNVKILHGSRDYFQVSESMVRIGKQVSGKTESAKHFIFECVPILEIKKPEQAKNITDISPLHTKWVSGKIIFARNRKGSNKSIDLCDEIRLTKAFCKANGIYGAESYINGLSGYACEVLTSYYGSFLKFVFAVSEKWVIDPKDKTLNKIIIDPENYWKTKSVKLELNSSKTTGPLILVDPVQASRNVTAAMSQEKFDLFRDRCHEFLRAPKEDFFFRRKSELHEINALVNTFPKSQVIIVKAAAKPGREDACGCALLKLHTTIVSELEKTGFTVFHKDWEFDKDNLTALMWFVVDGSELKKMKIHEGPPITMQKAVDEFKKKYSVIFEQDGRICAEVPRKFTKALLLVENIVESSKSDPKIKNAVIVKN